MKTSREHSRALLALIALLSVSVLANLGGCAASEANYKIESAYAVDDPQFQRTIGTLLGPPIVPGNAVVTLVNGDEIFPAMLESIARARRSISFETFIYWSGATGRAFADALSDRARAGVHVYVLIDAVGGWKVDGDYIKEMREAGAHVMFYHPLRWYDITSAARLNNRTHRKVLVVDGEVAFTGGVGIADEWQGHAQDPSHWRDTHYQVQGPVVAQLQAAFMDSWIQVTGEVLHDSDYFPPQTERGTMQAQFFMSSYRGGSESMHLMYLLSIAAARKSVCLATPYFVPDFQTEEALLKARERGVKVRILLPGEHIDYRFVRKASRARWGNLLKAGVEIYEYQPTMYHCKLMVIDDVWTSVGSTNLDDRSLRLNDEANLNVLDSSFAAQQVRIFEDDLTRSRHVTYEAWLRRPIWERIEEHTASLGGSQF